MREILFRGIDKSTCKWVYGDLLQRDEGRKIKAIMPPYPAKTGIVVKEDSVSEFTGLTDKNGVMIFEGDIVTFGENVYKIVFENGSFALFDESGGMIWKIGGHNDYCHSFLPSHFDCCWEDNYAYDIEIIGNIHDNPELLKKSAK